MGSRADRLLGFAIALGACVDLGPLTGGAQPSIADGGASDAGDDAAADVPRAEAATVDAATDATDATEATDATDAEDGGDAGPLSLGLIGYWKLDEGSGTVMADSSGRGNPGVAIGGITWDLGDGGSPSLLFDGASGLVEIAGSVAYATQKAPFSFSAWFNLTDIGNHYPDIMQVRTDSAYPWHVLLSDQPGYLGVSLGSADTWATIKTDNVPSTGKWHHVAVTYDGVDPAAVSSFRISLDGVSQTLTAANGYGAQAQQSRIGAAEAANFFDGAIRQVRIYDRALSAGEIALLYSAR